MVSWGTLTKVPLSTSLNPKLCWVLAGICRFPSSLWSLTVGYRGLGQDRLLGKGLELRLQGFGFDRVKGLGFRVSDLRCRVWFKLRGLELFLLGNRF